MLLLDVEAILLSTFVLMTQNRQSEESDQREHIHLQVALLAEQESTKMLQMLRAICERLGLNEMAGDPELAQMLGVTRVDELARELEKAREAPTGGNQPVTEVSDTGPIAVPAPAVEERWVRSLRARVSPCVEANRADPLHRDVPRGYTLISLRNCPLGPTGRCSMPRYDNDT